MIFFLKGKDGKDGQNGEIFNNYNLLFYREKLFIPITESIRLRLKIICFSLTELQFVFHTGKDGRDGINGDAAIF